MLDTLTAQMFSPHAGETFRLILDDVPPIELELVSVDELKPPRPATGTVEQPARMPFSLLFRNRQGLYLPQRIYHLEHEQFGAMEIFLVPLGPDAEGMRFEAIFN